MSAMTLTHAADDLPVGWASTGNYLILDGSAAQADKNDVTPLRNAAGAGIRYGKRLNKNFDLQLGINHVEGSKQVDSTDNHKSQQTSIGVDALYMFGRPTKRAFRPFLSLGMGLKQDVLEKSNVKSSDVSPFISAGAGFQWMFSNQVGLQASLRRLAAQQSDATGAKSSNMLNLGFLLAIEKSPTETSVTQAQEPPAYTTTDYIPAEPASPTPTPPTQLATEMQTITLSASSLFELNSAEINSSVAELNDLAVALVSNPQISSVVITGHTDQLGSESTNQRLSQARAQAVKDYLVDKGIEASRLIAKGVGSSQLVTNCKLPTRAEMITCGTKNRRVEIQPISINKP